MPISDIKVELRRIESLGNCCEAMLAFRFLSFKILNGLPIAPPVRTPILPSKRAALLGAILSTIVLDSINYSVIPLT